MAALLAACGEAADLQEVRSPADLVLTHGAFYTVDDDQPWAEAVAIDDGRFVYVGNNEAAAAVVGVTTTVHDLGGRMVLPGLVDAHTHPGLIAILGSDDPNGYLPYPADMEEILDFVKTHAEAHPEAEIILLGYWQVDMFGLAGPRKEDLDRVVPDRPVYLFDDTGHSAWVNSALLDRLGVDESTPDAVPELSFLERDENGEPTGWVKEAGLHRWFSATAEAAPSHEVLVERLHRVLTHLSRYGVTALLDAGNIGAEDRVYAALAELDRTGRLPLRYEATYHVRLPEQLPMAVAELERLREQYGGERLTFGTIKIHFDGIHEVRTAAILEPYSDDPGNRGATTISGKQLQRFILDLHDEAIDLHLHTNSDRAARLALDAVEGARKQRGGELATRVSLCHLELIADSDVPRFRRLDVSANFTLHWNGIGYLVRAWEAPLGPERTMRRFRIQPLLRDGAVVSFSSDETSIAGLSRTSPFFSMQVGHNRQEVGYGAEAEILPPLEERLALEDLVAGYTRGGAYQLRMEDELGAIQAGRAADLVILDRNLFETDPYEIHEITPLAVMVEGDVVQGSLP